MAETLRHRLRIATVAVVLLGGATTATALALGHSARQAAIPAGAVPGVLPTPSSAPCVTAAQARAVWQSIEDRTAALVRHPSIAGVAAIAQGTAATQLRQYVQQHLLDAHLTEDEVQRLDSLSLLQRGCGGQPLTVRAHVTLLQDDYLAADGHVDHRDPGVGQTAEVLESFLRTSQGWKVTILTTLSQATPTSGPTV